MRREAPALFKLYIGLFCRPALLNSYWREYFVSADRLVRATLDRDIRSFDQRLYSTPNVRIQVPQPEMLVLEMKGSVRESKTVREAVTAFGWRISRNSKYARGLGVQ